MTRMVISAPRPLLLAAGSMMVASDRSIRCTRSMSRKAAGSAPPSPPPSTVRTQLDRVADLQNRVGSVNSKAAKTALIGEYSDIRDILE